MSSVVQGAIYRDAMPVPHDPSITTYIEAGVVTLGVGYRHFDPAVALANYTAEQIEEAGGMEALLNDEGLTLHVFETESLDEYLRFDCFADEPHYHYIVPRVGQTFVRFDPLSNGPMLEWAAQAVRGRGAEMLSAVGAQQLASRLSAELLDRAVARAVEIGTQLLLAEA